MNSDHDGIDDGRRTFMKTLAIGATVGGAAAAGARPVAAQAATDLTDWFSNTGNAGEVTDMTGQDEVTVEVGTDGNGAAFGYGPAVVRVDPGTTVVWEWTGEGSPHNVVADDGSFESEMLSDSGATFEHVFESAGVTKYYCAPHEMMGMKGAVVVGDAQVSLGAGGSSGTAAPERAGGDGNETAGGAAASVDPDYDDWFANVGNFDGTVDRTGEDEVRIEVGAEGNDGPFAFSPAAVHVDPGTKVVWEWTGQGGGHNVYSEDPAFESPMQSEEGATYALEFDGQGVCQYACAPHEGAGMKGAVVVGDPAAGGGGGLLDLETALWGLAGAIVAAPFVASEVVARRRRKDEEGGRGGRRERPAD